MKKSRPEQSRALPVTTARARLFDLVEDLLEGRATRIELSHRDHDDSVVLVSKRELDAMEADLNALRGRAGPQPRPLRGLGALSVPPDDVLLRTRARQAAGAAEKRAAIAGAPAAPEREG